MAVGAGYLCHYPGQENHWYLVYHKEEETMTVFGGHPAEDGVGKGMPKDGFLVVCCKCGAHSNVEYIHGISQGKFVCTKKKCGNEAFLNEPIVAHSKTENDHVLPEDAGAGC